MNKASQIRVVLVRPRNPLNIGAAARAMLNFGFDDLVLVSPHPPVWKDARSAAGAQSVLRKAQVTTDLRSALEDRTLVIGTSSLSRRQPSQLVFDLSCLDSVLSGYEDLRLAILFGSEKSGLTNGDFSHCHMIARIPTSPRCPSMNLGQAVAICCYEMQRALLSSDNTPDRRIAAMTLASASDVDRLADGLSSLAEGARGIQTQRRLTVRVREMLLRWPMTVQDVALLLGLIRDIRWKMQNGREAETPREFSSR